MRLPSHWEAMSHLFVCGSRLDEQGVVNQLALVRRMERWLTHYWETELNTITKLRVGLG